MTDLPMTEAAEPAVLDIQHDPDPAQDHGPAKRIPHLGHAILFFSLAALALALCLTIFFSAAHIHTDAAALAHPGLALGAQALGYVLTLLVAAWLFPRLWQQSFLRGIQWNTIALRRYWYWIVAGGVLLSAVTQTALRFIPTPAHDPLQDLMITPHGAWLTAAFGVLLAPLTEEIAFRGFLLPAFATAYDWLALERSPAGLARWQSSSLHSTSALVFAAIFSSVPFALLHAGQLSHAWGVVSVLYGVSLVLSLVRIRFHSVSCSTLMHLTYNLTIFMVIGISSSGFRHLAQLKK
jgi:membrane protease YdiL (CAAX protease family)